MFNNCLFDCVATVINTKSLREVWHRKSSCCHDSFFLLLECIWSMAIEVFCNIWVNLYFYIGLGVAIILKPNIVLVRFSSITIVYVTHLCKKTQSVSFYKWRNYKVKEILCIIRVFDVHLAHGIFMLPDSRLLVGINLIHVFYHLASEHDCHTFQLLDACL